MSLIESICVFKLENAIEKWILNDWERGKLKWKNVE